jgi:hypothetical protein
VVIPGCLKANDDRTIETGQPFQEVVVLSAAVEYRQPDTARLSRDLDQYVVAQFRDIDGYQGRAFWRRLRNGHRSDLQSVDSQNHFRDLRPGPDRLPEP